MLCTSCRGLSPSHMQCRVTSAWSFKRLAGSSSKRPSDGGRDDVKAELCGHYGRVVE
jgi:hypothetical protein